MKVAIIVIIVLVVIIIGLILIANKILKSFWDRF